MSIITTILFGYIYPLYIFLPITLSMTPPPVHTNCTAGWKITGYFLPLESEYTGPTQTVSVDGVDRTFNAKFLTDSKMEGWGKTKAGDYIGNYGSGGELGFKSISKRP